MEEIMVTLKQVMATNKLPSAEEIQAFCTWLHGLQVDHDAPEMLWMSTSFEDMADVMTKAIVCSEREFSELLQEEAACAA